MQDFDNQEQRLAAALQRIATAAERLQEAPPAAEAAEPEMDTAAEVEIARLARMLDRMQAEAAQKDEAAARLRSEQEARIETLTRDLAIAEAAATDPSPAPEAEFDPVAIRALIDEALDEQQVVNDRAILALRQRVTSQNAQLEAQADDARRLRGVNMQMRAALRDLRATLTDGVVDAALINRALEAELNALQGLRQADLADLDRLLAAIDPLLEGDDTGAPANQEGADA